MNKRKISHRIRVRLRQRSLMANVSKEIVWIKRTEDQLRKDMKIPSELCWFDMMNEDLASVEDLRQPRFMQAPENVPSIINNMSVEDEIKLWLRQGESIVMADETKKVDLDSAQSYVPCFGCYRGCKVKKDCHLAQICKQEESRLKAQEKAGTNDKFVHVRNDRVEKNKAVRQYDSFESLSKDQIERLKRTNRPQYFRYLKHCILTDREVIALEAAEHYEARVRKIIRKPFYVAVGQNSDPTKHKNWAFFMRVADRVLQKETNVTQYMDAIFFYSKSKSGFPPVNSLASDNSAKKYDQYEKEYIKKLGTKIQKVWEPSDPLYISELQLQSMWMSGNRKKLFPSKDFWLMHGKNTSIARLPQFSEQYLRNKYPGELYDIVEQRYKQVLENLEEHFRPVYLKDMLNPALYVDVYSRG